ncbi:MAG: histidine--tRNA ligase [Chlorobi bacterium]|nr:histidine--tRNA ligase [Chlorobiota bacterium]
MAVKPSIPKGTRDFNPIETVRRNYIFDTIKKVFYLFGYLPIETPAMENLETLMGKYGEEGDRLIFKILNSGNFLAKVPDEEIEKRNVVSLSNKISEKALRYDLTVPFARYVVQHRNEITFPFKRFQIQPVWRADRPQKGRYREFFQCDVDVIGSNALLNEVELLQIADEIFGRFGINIIIKLNNRKILAGIAELIGNEDKITHLTVAIDKMEKIGYEKVISELNEKGFDETALRKLEPILKLKGTNSEKINKLEEILSSSETGLKGISETKKIFEYLSSLKLNSKIELDLTLARGLNYYTGAIIEIKSADFEIGSICGGGRYDDLTGIFGLKDVSGVGISFGADRIYDVLNHLEKFPHDTETSSKIMIVNFGEKEEKYCLSLIENIRKAGIPSELYPSSAKLKKQMIYANNKKIPYVILIGEEEIKSNTVTLKNMNTGEQQKLSEKELIKTLNNM